MARFRFWKPKESFFILEILPGRVNGLLLGLGPEQRLIPRKYFEGASWSHLSKRPDLRHLVKNIVIAGDSSVAFTALVPVYLKRENRSHPLAAVELENLLAQEVGKVFSQCRKDASKHLKVDELDVILVTSRVMNFKIDGHYVLNPLGFKASSVEVMLELILTTRAVFEDIRSFAKERQDFFFTELTRSEANILQKTEKLPMSILSLGEARSAYAVVEPAKVGQTIARGIFSWTTGELIKKIEEKWLVNRETAEVIYDLYLKNEISAETSKAIARIIAPAEKAFFREFRDLKTRGPVYVDSDRPLPWPLPAVKYGRKLVPCPMGRLLDHFGFRTDFASWPIRPEGAFRFLAPFWDFYYDRSDTTVNRWLRRHLNWLGSSL